MVACASVPFRASIMIIIESEWTIARTSTNMIIQVHNMTWSVVLVNCTFYVWSLFLFFFLNFFTYRCCFVIILLSLLTTRPSVLQWTRNIKGWLTSTDQTNYSATSRNFVKHQLNVKNYKQTNKQTIIRFW